jgi:hypothetical protein
VIAGAAAATGISGKRKPLLFDLLDEDVGFPRLLELDCFFDFVWDDLLVDVVVSDRPVVVVVDDFAVVEPVDGLRVVDVVDDEAELFVVVDVDEDELLVLDELDAVVADDEDDEDDDVASVIWMSRCPSFDSEFPSLTTKLKPSTSTPDGAW